MKYIAAIFFLCYSYISKGQITLQPKQQDFEYKGVVYKREKAVDFTLHTNGFSLAYNNGKIGAFQNTSYTHFEIGYLRDPREKSQNKNLSFNINELSSSFKYGKQNYAIMLRAAKGRKKFLSEKAKRKGIAIGYNYQYGATVGLLIPYYLEIIKSVADPEVFTYLEAQRYEDNPEEFLDYDNIFGSAGFFKGLGETAIYPGLHGKLGLLFSFGLFDKTIKSVEVGIMGDLFLKKIPIMVETDVNKNRPYFFNFYLTFQFGKRKF